MFADRHFHRSGRWHAAPAPLGFRITFGPTVESISTSSVQVRWTCSDVCSGQVAYGTTSSYGSTTVEQSIVGGYTQHVQEITGLSPGTTYHFKVISTDAASTTVESADATFSTSSTQAYGTRAAPAIPTNVITVSGVAYNDTGDVTSVLQAIINAAPPGSIIVFDQTGTAEGTTPGVDTPACIYRINSSIRITKPLTLWGYNSRIHTTRTTDDSTGDNDLAVFFVSSTSDVHILGFDIQGPNTVAGLPNQGYETYGIAHPHGVALAWDPGTVEIADCYMWNLNGDGIYVGAWAKWNVGPLHVHHNFFNGVGRNWITLDQHSIGTCYIEWNRFDKASAWGIDIEDALPSGTTGAKWSNIVIRNNEFGGWLSDDYIAGFGHWCLQVNHLYNVDQYSDFGPCTVQDNVWTSAGILNTISTSYHEGVLGIAVPFTATYTALNVGVVHDWVITGNDMSALPAAQRSGQYAVGVGKCTNLTITNNDFGGMSVQYPNASGTINVSNNT